MKADDRASRNIHHRDRNDDGGDHDLDVLRHADRGHNQVDREHQIDRDHLHDDQMNACAALGGHAGALARSISLWISCVALAIRKSPPPIRMMSCQEISLPNSVITG